MRSRRIRGMLLITSRIFGSVWSHHGSFWEAVLTILISCLQSAADRFLWEVLCPGAPESLNRWTIRLWTISMKDCGFQNESGRRDAFGEEPPRKSSPAFLACWEERLLVDWPSEKLISGSAPHKASRSLRNMKMDKPYWPGAAQWLWFDLEDQRRIRLNDDCFGKDGPLRYLKARMLDDSE